MFVCSITCTFSGTSHNWMGCRALLNSFTPLSATYYFWVKCFVGNVGTEGKRRGKSGITPSGHSGGKSWMSVRERIKFTRRNFTNSLVILFFF